MFTYITSGTAEYVPVGVIVIYLLLLVYSLLIFVYRLSKAASRTFIFIIIAAVFGLTNGACLLYLSLKQYYYSSLGNSIPNMNVLPAALFFGYALVPMTWMSGLSIFSNILGKRIQISLSYLLTLIQLILIIAAAAIYGMYLNSYTTNSTISYAYIHFKLIIAVTALQWLYFLLFFSLVIQHRSQLSGLGKSTLVAFGVLNTIRLIVSTVFLSNLGYEINLTIYIFVFFFTTDFLSAISMGLLVTFYRGIMSNNDHMYDN